MAKEKAVRRPVRELFAEACRGGKNVAIAKLKAVAKRAGVGNFDNRFYWFRKTGAPKLGLKVVMNEEKGTVKLVKGPMFHKPKASKKVSKKARAKVHKMKARKSAKRAAAKKSTHQNVPQAA